MSLFHTWGGSGGLSTCGTLPAKPWPQQDVWGIPGMLHGVGIQVQIISKEELAAPVCSQAGAGHGDGQGKGSWDGPEDAGGAWQRWHREGGIWVLSRAAQPAWGPGWMLRGSCSGKKSH